MDDTRYQVFVSSTFTDLKDEREKALQAILQRRAFPAGMELFPAADQDQFEFIKREIDSSDYYIVIIAGKYGTVADDGLSYTEKEYDYAKSKGKPILAFLHKDILQLKGGKLDLDQESRDKLTAFREKARGSKLVSFYENPDELKAQVYHALTTQFDLRPMRGWVRAGTTSREDLERINALQEQVLQLEQDNRRLLARSEEIESTLAGGSDSITWHLNLDDANISGLWPTKRDVEIETSWDDLLLFLFSRGSSYANERDVKIALLTWLTNSPQFEAPGVWLTNLDAQMRMNRQWIPNFKAVQELYIGLHAQFTGLGLISESQETVYVPSPNGPSPMPKTMSVWKLTAKGEKRLALARGFKR